eukprot:XP_008769588.1 PREDICTED: beta-defensin 11 isoform X1 [Rattus norvegicus]
MRTLCSLLLIGCLLFSYDTPVVGFLRRSVSGFQECHRGGKQLSLSSACFPRKLLELHLTSRTYQVFHKFQLRKRPPRLREKGTG